MIGDARLPSVAQAVTGDNAVERKMPKPSQRQSPTVPGFSHLVIALFALGAILSAGVVPGIFTVDENNYLVTVLALRHGHLTLPNTSGLLPSQELLFFDPASVSRAV